jgi:hypothetical protein
MPVLNELPQHEALSPEIEVQLEQQIQKRTFGRVRRPKVDVLDDHLVVHGSASCYYVVQLAVLAVRDLVPTMPVQLDIRVGATPNA